jgi:hypothetical protein
MVRHLEEQLELTEQVYFETPEQRARRIKLRRVVLGALGASVALLMVGVLLRYRGESSPLLPSTNALSTTATLNALLPSDASSVVASAAPMAPASVAPAVSAAAVTDASTNAFTQAARSLLESGHTREGVEAARRAVEANPSDAEPYILLATGLQDLGKWPEAHAVFKTCEQKVQGGNAGCRYFARL